MDISFVKELWDVNEIFAIIVINHVLYTKNIPILLLIVMHFFE